MLCNNDVLIKKDKQTNKKPFGAQLKQANTTALFYSIKDVSCFYWLGSNKPKQNNQSVTSSKHIKGSFVLLPSLQSTAGRVHTWS